MGTPQKIDVNGTPVFICCGGCRESLLKNPDKYLAELAAGGVADESMDSLPPMDLPPIEMLEIQFVEPMITHAEDHSVRRCSLDGCRFRIARIRPRPEQEHSRR